MTATKLTGVVNVFRILLGTVGLGLLLAGSASAAPPDKDANDAYWWWGDFAGTSRIVRTDNGISGNISVHLGNDTGSAKGLAITLWIVIFNNTEECTGPEGACIEDDLFNNPAVMADVVYGGGNIVGASERATIGFHYKAGENKGSIADIFGLPRNVENEGFGLLNPRGAEVHYVIRLHGPVVPAAMPAQIQSYEGGCIANAPIGFPFPTGSTDLHLELGDCQDVIFAINPPPSP